MTRKVYGFHVVHLRPGVDPQTFERFALDEFLPALDALDVQGVEFSLLRADRGARAGERVFLMVFDDVATRDRWFPRADRPSEELVALVAPLRARCRSTGRACPRATRPTTSSSTERRTCAGSSRRPPRPGRRRGRRAA